MNYHDIPHEFLDRILRQLQLVVAIEKELQLPGVELQRLLPNSIKFSNRFASLEQAETARAQAAIDLVRALTYALPKLVDSYKNRQTAWIVTYGEFDDYRIDTVWTSQEAAITYLENERGLVKHQAQAFQNGKTVLVEHWNDPLDEDDPYFIEHYQVRQAQEGCRSNPADALAEMLETGHGASNLDHEELTKWRECLESDRSVPPDLT